jgi:hypothetical protein
VDAVSDRPALPQGGSGPIKVLFVSKGHFFDRDGLMSFFDQPWPRQSTGRTSSSRPAQVFYDQKNCGRILTFLRSTTPPAAWTPGGQSPAWWTVSPSMTMRRLTRK